MSAERAYIIACLERTGSNLLCGALRATRRLGDPDEWLGQSRLHNRLVAAGLNAAGSTKAHPRPRDFAQYVAMLGSSTSSGGVFGAKVHWYQLSAAVANGWVRGLWEVVPPSARGRMAVVRLRRVDRVAQAVSIHIAQTTGMYVLPADGSRPGSVHHDKPYWAERRAADVNDELSQIVTSIDRAEEAWDENLAGLDVPILSIDYESLVADYVTVVRRVVDFVGGGDISASDVPPPSTLRQANEVNMRLAANYCKQLHLPQAPPWAR